MGCSVYRLQWNCTKGKLGAEYGIGAGTRGMDKLLIEMVLQEEGIVSQGYHALLVSDMEN